MISKAAFSGSGGQGVLMMGYLLAVAGMRDGKHVTYLPSYGAEVRGGTANCTVSVADEEIASPVASSPDSAVVLNKPSMKKFEGMIKSGGLMIINSSLTESEPERNDIDILKVPANDIASELGSERTLNMIMLGAFATKTGVTSLDSLKNSLAEVMKGKKASIIELNIKGLEKGAEYVSTQS